GDVKKRANKVVDQLRTDTGLLEYELRNVQPLTPENIFLRLHQEMSKYHFFWGVYQEVDNRLIAWSGQLPYKDTYLAPGAEEITVITNLHQQFLRYRHAIKLEGGIYYVSVLTPIAADYGIENRYLTSYNILTDGLAIRPDLLYNSPQSTT